MDQEIKPAEPNQSLVEMTGEATKPLVLEFEQVSFRGRQENGLRLRRANLQLCAGELAVIRLDAATRTREAASMIQGLSLPAEGNVRFCGEDWHGQDYRRHFRMRSRLGRVFEGQAWIENLNVDENVTLASRHHGMSAESIQQSVEYWVSRLGLHGLTRKRPAFVEPSVLQLHQWIRAFLGSPSLVILERPLQFLSTDWVHRFAEIIEEIRSKGVAVLWFAGDQEVATAAFTKPVVQLSLQDKALCNSDGGSGNE
jgi:phospholipid/cholesterol/gamma-HCH transport system ATP-binding protein